MSNELEKPQLNTKEEYHANSTNSRQDTVEKMLPKRSTSQATQYHVNSHQSLAANDSTEA
jgi:hypothetical protein